MANRSVVSGIIGGVIGATASAAFWAGHEFWPKATDTTAASVSSASAVSSAAMNKPLTNATPAQILPLAENTIADIAKQSSDSVVKIDISKKVEVADPFEGMNGFQFYFGRNGFQTPHPRRFESRGTGAGVIYRSDGYILTNFHVVGQADNIVVYLNDGRKFNGKVVGRDFYTDLALVKIDANNLHAAKFGSSENLRPGDWAIAIGSPMGFDHSVTLGIISALNRNIRSDNNVELIQTDAAINPGNSGGPLLNIHGDVIGLNVAIIGDAQNIGFAIPVDVVKDVAQQLLTNGSIQRAYLGIAMQNLEPDIAKSLGMPSNTQGVLVAHTEPNSPAEQAGLQPGDVIQKIDGKNVASAKEVQNIVIKHKPDDRLNLLIARSGELKGVSVTVGKRKNKEES
jgi:Do/DeqQ family serine protease